MKNGDYHQGSSSSSNLGSRIIEELDFFDDNRTGLAKTHEVPALEGSLKEIIFPILMKSPPQPEAVLLFVKRLEYSDVRRNQNQNRLLITGGDRLMAALTEEERERVEREGEMTVCLEVPTTDPRGVEHLMGLKRLPAAGGGGGGGGSVVLMGWLNLVDGNGLKKGDSVQGWGYRINSQFRLHINIARSS